MNDTTTRSNPAARRPGPGARLNARLAIVLMLLASMPTLAQWAAEPGERVRNAFGPVESRAVRACRGACGPDCPSTCTRRIVFECADDDRLRRVRTLACGTHQGCREHDDCLDRCSQQQAQGFDCANQCNAQAIADYGFEVAGPWAMGGGPYDGEIVFEYTVDRPGAPEAAYRCPDGAERSCGDDGASCVAGGTEVSPVFASYPDTESGALEVLGFRSGRVCLDDGEPASVCENGVEIQITGDAPCPGEEAGENCSWYGFELEYDHAAAGETLACTSTGADEDFLGGVVTRVIEAMPAQQGSALGDLLGGLQKGLEGGGSLADVLAGITVTPNDGSGRTLGSAAAEPAQPPGVPKTVSLDAPSGRVLVPMYETRDGSRGRSQIIRDVRCTHRGVPVLETSFRLQFANR